jgi:hypothetical protein
MRQVWKPTVIALLLLYLATSALDTESKVSLALQKHCCIMQGAAAPEQSALYKNWRHQLYVLPAVQYATHARQHGVA